MDATGTMARARVAPRGGARGIALGLALLATFAGAGCAPELGVDPVPVVMQFDPTADPPRSPEPTEIVINPETGLIDFGVLGWWLPTYPEDCLDQPAWPVAACEFNVYLQTLDGFPTVSSARAPVSAPLDLASITVPENLFVASDRGEVVTDLEVGFDAEKGYLTIARAAGWDLGRTYVVAVRGYDHGVRAADGRRVVASTVYFLLKKEESLLTCEPDPQTVPASEQVLNVGCKYYDLMALNYGEGAAPGLLRDLEALRQALIAKDFWRGVRNRGNLPKEEVAILWAFPIHTASVAELNPQTGKVPIPASADTILLPVRGTVDPGSLQAFSLLGGGDGTVILLDLTALGAGDMTGGFPAFSVLWNGAENAIQLTAEAHLTPGRLYGVILTGPAKDEPAPRRGVTDSRGVPLVPSPVTVLLRSRGPVVDSLGRSVVSVLDDTSAAELEAGRLQLEELLDNETFTSLAQLTRENIVYLYGFEWEAP